MRKMWKWLRNLFRKNKDNNAPPSQLVYPPSPPEFVATFSDGDIDTNVWTVSAWQAPGNNSINTGLFSADHVSIRDNCLCLKLTQEISSSNVAKSTGAEVATVRKFQYGTFEFDMRASSTAAGSKDRGAPVSGSITGAFVYHDKAITEIDVEIEGNARHSLTQFTSWVGERNANQNSKVPPSAAGVLPHDAFFKYAFVWTPSGVDFYRDGVLVATHTTVVPTESASIMLNHWGTNLIGWGGSATANVPRYMWVRGVKYWPLS